jgi:hypothetical protein
MGQIVLTIVIWELITWGLRTLWYDYINKQ